MSIPPLLARWSGSVNVDHEREHLLTRNFHVVRLAEVILADAVQPECAPLCVHRLSLPLPGPIAGTVSMGDDDREAAGSYHEGTPSDPVENDLPIVWRHGGFLRAHGRARGDPRRG